MQDKLSAGMQIAERTRCDQGYIGREFFGMNGWFADGAARERESGPLRCKLVKETLNREP